jgi:hypothetical protein
MSVFIKIFSKVHNVFRGRSSKFLSGKFENRRIVGRLVANIIDLHKAES